MAGHVFCTSGASGREMSPAIGIRKVGLRRGRSQAGAATAINCVVSCQVLNSSTKNKLNDLYQRRLIVIYRDFSCNTKVFTTRIICILFLCRSLFAVFYKISRPTIAA